ncbi:S-adenosyl-L-methionine-dependent methyltransferase [Penicillium canescens]|uniref:S-adenosyl-L-methionine-dependent methyltransferase n=1 Tax=Penicillium canescens TaxID=5083 RepID=A0AAD6IHH6_PENCN|nr:S-adenosyl-L-methionine-dependent methyltransferase [Penicillium canescens]KAJ6004204.1 S-adenosyl-L-methionine-dependent methyltransferase [Penicillium canescens]KAJ6029128.1 S-adenosyl-L-methionine-dependent methyltransferase [Penicillium canescens]KAJ6047560.1 S-adenosyl-L-methionine-dependent methyltransferase [Penicillium canescens]KAJ6048843.1 S-adenosyl-L-methionine-dependent methyltransferase [Penicillium canescens]KAJ6100644.1 S-adenosyl-L-methionine-dependent methyltransferase [Pe
MIDPYNSAIEYLLRETTTRVEKYASSGNESARVDALDQCLKLSRALEKPKDAVLKLSLSPVLFMAVKVGHDLEIFSRLVKSGPATAKELAVTQNADPALLERILRTLASIGYVEERGTELYAPSPLSYEMTQRTTIGMMDSLFREWQRAITRAPEFLQIAGYRNPEDTRDESKDQLLLVDLGGGRGHGIAYFASRFPDAPGRLILEDLPPVIDCIKFGSKDRTSQA